MCVAVLITDYIINRNHSRVNNGPSTDRFRARFPGQAAREPGQFKVAELEAWLKRTGGAPREVAMRQRVRTRLGG